MLVQDQVVQVEWSRSTKKYFQEKGYVFTNYGDTFDVDVHDLKKHYKGKVRVVCDVCGKEYTMAYNSYNNALERNRFLSCQSCGGLRLQSRSLEQRQEEHYKVLVSMCKQRGYRLLTAKEEIINNKSAVQYECPIHGLVTTKMSNIRLGHGCPQCGHIMAVKNSKLTTLSARQESLYNKALKVAQEQGYTIISKPTDILRNTSEIIFECPKHGLHSMRISNFINGKRCVECTYEQANLRNRMSNQEVFDRVIKCGGQLLNIQDYKNNNTRNLWITCPKCHKPFQTSLILFTQRGGQLCPDCSNTESLGQVRVRHFLQDNNVEFEQQKWFSDCRDKHPLPFDFYLQQNNIIIQFDGQQHYDSKNGYFHHSDSTQKHDVMKNQYCADHGIEMIRIPYWDYNHIEQILTNKLKLHKDMV